MVFSSDDGKRPTLVTNRQSWPQRHKVHPEGRGTDLQADGTRLLEDQTKTAL